MTLDEFYSICDNIQPDEYGCLNYPNPPGRDGNYGRVRITDPETNRICSDVVVHRLALERELGRKIKPGLFVLHHCDNRSCVNPDHLYEGTLSDNSLDKIRRNPECMEPVYKGREVYWRKYHGIT